MTERLQHGGVYLVNLNSPRKNAPAEMSKVRPAVVIQTQALLDIDHSSAIVVPLTTNLKTNNLLRYRIPAQGRLQEDSDCVLDQIKSINVKRFVSVSPLCVLPEQEVMQLLKALLLLLKP